MEQTKEFSVTLDDRPGTLAKATDAIAKAGINIDGYCAVPSGNQGKGTFRVVTKDPAGTRKALEAAGFKVQDERDAAVIDVEDRPGVVAQIFRRLAENELDHAKSDRDQRRRFHQAARDSPGAHARKTQVRETPTHTPLLLPLQRPSGKERSANFLARRSPRSRAPRRRRMPR